MDSVIAPTLAAHLPTTLLIDGVWSSASTGATFEVHNPATEETLFDVADASPADGLRALDAAAGAARLAVTTTYAADQLDAEAIVPDLSAVRFAVSHNGVQVTSRP